jgi:integrase/recombinase XerD
MITANMNYSLEDYLTDIEIKNYSKATIKNKKSIIESFERWIGDTYKVELEEITSRMCKRYIKHMMDEGVKANTINTGIKTIRNFYKFCIKEKIVKENPFEEIELLKEEKVMIKPFSLEQIQKMIGFYYDNTFMDSRNRAILTCLFETGIRSQELAGITMQDLFDDAILIRGKGNKQRLVPISLYLKRELAKYKKEREKYLKKTNMEDCPFLFVCTRTNGGNNKTNKPIGKNGS